MFKIMQQYGDTYEFESAAEIVDELRRKQFTFLSFHECIH